MEARAVHLTLFGTPTITAGGRSLAMPFERRTQLAVLLALRRQWVPRAELASMLWPERETKLAFANLRKTLFRLPLLAWTAGIELQDTALRFDVPTDVVAFEEALREQRHAEAVGAYRGDLLAGFDDGQSEAWTRWVAFERDRLRAAWRSAALAQLADTAVEPAQAVVLSTRLLDADPLDEAALQHHLDALVRAGQAGAARAAYRQFVDRLKQDLGLEPGPGLRSLHDSLVGGVPRPDSAAALATPLEAPDGGFVGRAVELHRIQELLSRDECRLLCLIGPGGVGKTRLARHAHRALARAFADGAAFIALEDVDTPEQFGLRLAQEADVKVGPSGDPLLQAMQAWRDQQLLLVLDNFEQLADHAPRLDEMLQHCPRMKILVTSRVRLAVAGEWSMPIEGLPCPDAEDADHAESFDAVRLFVNAARRVEPAFDPSADGAAIVDICQRVQGLPLALELAAAWVRVLPCAAIAEELRRGTELLQAADQSHPPRHASVDAVFEQSWQRISLAEREALSRLSVFRGGFSFDAARAVASVSLPVLGALSDKSLVAKDAGRMHLHPLVQQLAALRLSEQDRAKTEAAHAHHFLGWLARLRPAVETAEGTALRAIDDEFENCRRAWRVAAQTGQADAVRNAAFVARSYFDFRGRLAQGLAWLQQTLESQVCRADVGLRAMLLGDVAHFQYRLGQFDAARASAAEALGLCSPARDRVIQCRALSVLGGCALQQGRLADARRHYTQALAITPKETTDKQTAATLDHLAIVEKRLGHYEESLRLSNESLAQHRRLGDHAGVALCLSNLATTYVVLLNYDMARTHLLEALAISEREGEVLSRPFVLGNLSEVSMYAGDLALAREQAARALEFADQTGRRSQAGWLNLHLARIASRQGDLQAARDAVAAGTAILISLGSASLYPAAVLALAELLDAQGERACARQVLAFAARHPSTAAPERDELHAVLASMTSPGDRDKPWPGLSLDELLNRVVAEAGLAHRPLISVLTGVGLALERSDAGPP